LKITKLNYKQKNY